MKIYPSLLTASLTEFEQQLKLVKESGVIKVVQIDVIDGYFANNLTLSPLDISTVSYGDLKLDFHLMTEEPLDFVYEIIALKDFLPIRAIIAQVERMSSQADFIIEVKKQGWRAGFSLDLYTPIEAIDPASWQELDFLQLMTIQAGFQGQEFQRRVLDKIVKIRKLASSDLEIIIDGGVKKSQLQDLLNTDVDGVAIGSGFWQTAEPVQIIKKYFRLAK